MCGRQTKLATPARVHVHAAAAGLLTRSENKGGRAGKTETGDEAIESQLFKARKKLHIRLRIE